MTALSKDRLTKERTGGRRSFGVKAATTIFAGSIVALDANDYAVPGAVATTLVSVGVAAARADNSAGANNAIRVEAKTGIFRFNNSASSDEITIGEIGTPCYIVDDQTVAKTDGSSTRSVAGTVFDVDADGVWVKFD